MENLCYLSIAEASRRIARGDLKPEDLTRAHLERIAALDSKLRSYITVTGEIAMRQARERGAGSRLRGIPISYKDLIATAGVRTTGASRVYADWTPQRDAHVVARLRRAGTVMLGKATLNEFAFSGTSEEDFIKPARNPWNTSASAGLSSSGSAAGVAAGLAMASIATDSGGSIRIPASYCGVTGMKPTYGLVGRSGVIALSYSCDHVGVIARSAEDAALVLNGLAGYDPEDPGSRRLTARDYTAALNAGIRGLRIGICRPYLEAVGLERGVESAFETAVARLRSLGAEVREVELPHIAYAPAADFTILRAEGYSIHLENLQQKQHLYGASAFRQIAAGGFLGAVDYYRALQVRTLILNEVNRAFRAVDLLAMPTTPRTALPGPDSKRGSDSKVAGSSVAFLAPFNLSGHPAVSVPCGFTQTGAPVGLELVGRAFGEAVLLRAAHSYQTATGWHQRHPEVT